MGRYWFKRRRYGWGWTPVTWQGWVTVLLWLAIVLGAGATILDVPEEQSRQEVGFFLTFVLIATLTLLRISYAKGPKPHWRWGKSAEDDPDEDL